jgi:hypothetical protein
MRRWQCQNRLPLCGSVASLLALPVAPSTLPAFLAAGKLGDWSCDQFFSVLRDRAIAHMQTLPASSKLSCLAYGVGWKFIQPAGPMRGRGPFVVL